MGKRGAYACVCLCVCDMKSLSLFKHLFMTSIQFEISRKNQKSWTIVATRQHLEMAKRNRAHRMDEYANRFSWKLHSLHIHTATKDNVILWIRFIYSGVSQMNAISCVFILMIALLKILANLFTNTESLLEYLVCVKSFSW